MFRPSVLVALVALTALLALLLPCPTDAMIGAGTGPGWQKLGKYNTRKGSKWLLDQRRADRDWRPLGPDTGIFYRVIEAGTGDKHPTREASIKIHVAGKDITGRVFEDSWRSGKGPEKRTVGGLLSAWQHALTRMVEGDEWELLSPGTHGFGQYGSQADKLGPFEFLQWELRLVSIETPKHSVARTWKRPAWVDPDAKKGQEEPEAAAAAKATDATHKEADAGEGSAEAERAEL